MTNKKLIEQIAEHTGFQPEPIEKVLFLQSILNGLCEQEVITDTWVLKGGTALNLFYLDLPRLSVDIDLNFIGTVDVSKLPDARKEFERVLILTCERERCSVKRIPDSHAGGKFRLKYQSELGGSPDLEVDVNYLLRVPLLGVEKRVSVFPPEQYRESNVAVPVLTFEELAAGKFTALLDRFAARDVFDVLKILEMKPALLSNSHFRATFMCYLGSSRKDVREGDSKNYVLESNEVKQRLIPLLRDEKGEEHVLQAVDDTIRPTIEKLLAFSDSEEKFLDGIHKRGELEPSLIVGEEEFQTRISIFPPLLWRCKQVKKHLS